MKKIEIEIPDGHKEVIKKSDNGVVIEWVKIDKEQEMRDFLKPFLTNLLLVKDERYPNSVFYKQGGKIIFVLEKTETELRFWVDYYKIWSVFRDRFGINYNEIQSFIKTVVEDTLNLRGITPIGSIKENSLLVEDTLNLRGITPNGNHTRINSIWKKL